MGLVLRLSLNVEFFNQEAGDHEVVVDDIAAAVAKDGYRFDTLVVEVATSLPFRFRRSR